MIGGLQKNEIIVFEGVSNIWSTLRLSGLLQLSGFAAISTRWVWPACDTSGLPVWYPCLKQTEVRELEFINPFIAYQEDTILFYELLNAPIIYRMLYFVCMNSIQKQTAGHLYLVTKCYCVEHQQWWEKSIYLSQSKEDTKLVFKFCHWRNC